MTRPVPRADVDRELARARGARRVLPWAVLSALAGGAIGLVAGGGLRAAGTLVLVGLLLAGYVWTASRARCPACGASLPSRGGPLAGCPRCRNPYDG
ncbi:MAG TPA: hypothetical protein VIW03_18280 [Anaeromyxobacter sp.]